MGIYLEDNKLDSVLENYFEEENNLVYESCMKEYLTEMYHVEAIYEAKKTEEEKEAEKKEKFEARIAKAKESIKKHIQKKMTENSKKYETFKLDCHQATNKERAQYLGLVGAASVTGGLVGGAAGATGNAIAFNKAAKKAVDAGIEKTFVKGVAKAAAKNTAKSVLKTTAGVSAIMVAGALLVELIKMKRFKDVYTIKLYGIKEDGSEKLIGWWTSVKIQKSDLDSEFKNKIK
jgi:hypothetical protein